MGLLTSFSFLLSVKECSHGNQLKSTKCGPVFFVTLPFRNRLQYRNSDFKGINRMNFSALCTILVTFGRPVTPEFTLLTITPFAAIRQKSAYHAKYLRISWTYLDLLYRFGRCVGGIIIPVTQGTLQWQPVKFGALGDVRRHRQERPLLFALAFDNGLADCEAAFKTLNGNNPATLCTNLVNFMLLKRVIFAAIRPQFDNDLYSSHWHSETDWKIAIFDFRRVMDNQFCTSCRIW